MINLATYVHIHAAIADPCGAMAGKFSAKHLFRKSDLLKVWITIGRGTQVYGACFDSMAMQSVDSSLRARHGNSRTHA